MEYDGLAPETTLHDVRWGCWYKGNGIDDFVWVLEISGSVPPAHLSGGFSRALLASASPPCSSPKVRDRSRV
jgi:hypothetical protein